MRVVSCHLTTALCMDGIVTFDIRDNGCIVCCVDGVERGGGMEYKWRYPKVLPPASRRHKGSTRVV